MRSFDLLDIVSHLSIKIRLPRNNNKNNNNLSHFIILEKVVGEGQLDQ
jgi:hypothetical protein